MLQYTWADFDRDATGLAKTLRELMAKSFPPIQAWGVYGIPRGGLVLATYLSHALNAPLYTRDFDWHLPVVVVDDNVVTGATLNHFAPKAFATATLIQNPNARLHDRPHLYARTSTEWPIFPWEPA